MIFINLVTATALNGRDAPDGNIVWQAGMKVNDILACDDKSGVWYRVRAVVRGGTNVALPAPTIWASAGATGSFQRALSSFEGKPPALTFSIDGGEQYQNITFDLQPK